jgi:hypothetical protein
VSELLYIAIALACPIGMVLMMALMGKGMSRRGRGHMHRDTETVDELRAEHVRLGSEIERLEKDRSAERHVAER